MRLTLQTALTIAACRPSSNDIWDKNGQATWRPGWDHLSLSDFNLY
jgi:hypothetical protein